MDFPERALARWIAHGVTSRTHPVLDWALRTFFNPLGITADSLECEPFSALESGLGGWWLRQPRWDAVLLDLGHPAARDFRPLLDTPESFVVAVDPRGQLSISLRGLAAGDPVARRFRDEGEQGWRAARHAVRAAHDAEAFLFGAAGLILAGDPAAEQFADGDDAGFCRAAAGRILNPVDGSPHPPGETAGRPEAEPRPPEERAGGACPPGSGFPEAGAGRAGQDPE